MYRIQNLYSLCTLCKAKNGLPYRPAVLITESPKGTKGLKTFASCHSPEQQVVVLHQLYAPRHHQASKNSHGVAQVLSLFWARRWKDVAKPACRRPMLEPINWVSKYGLWWSSCRFGALGNFWQLVSTVNWFGVSGFQIYPSSEPNLSESQLHTQICTMYFCILHTDVYEKLSVFRG